MGKSTQHTIENMLNKYERIAYPGRAGGQLAGYNEYDVEKMLREAVNIECYAIEQENKELKERADKLTEVVKETLQKGVELKEQRDELLKLVDRFIAGIKIDGEVKEHNQVYLDAVVYKNKIASTKQD